MGHVPSLRQAGTSAGNLRHAIGNQLAMIDESLYKIFTAIGKAPSFSQQVRDFAY